MDFLESRLENLMINDFPLESKEEFEEDDDDIFVILNEEDKRFALENNLKIAYSDIDLEDDGLIETLVGYPKPSKKNR